jgi:hypothetical protein
MEHKGSSLAGACQACGLDLYGVSGHACAPDGPPLVNGAGIELSKLRQSTGRPKGARNLRAKHPSSLARRFKAAGLDWAADFAQAIRANKRDRIAMWMRLLPYMVTTSNKSVKVKRWKGRASKAAMIALDALEGRP